MTTSRQVAIVAFALLGLVALGQAFLTLLPAALK